VPVRGAHGPLELEVIGAVPDYTWNRGTLIVDRAWFREAFADDELDIFDVFLRPGTDPGAVKEAVERLGRDDALVAQTRDELRAEIASTLRRVYSLAYAQQVVVGLVALLGVVSALFISVLQRRRELGLLRAVGATRGQVLRSVLAEATLMGLVGSAVGLAVGVVLEWYVVKLLLFDDAGWVFPLHVPWAAAGAVSGLCVLAATLVGLWPAVQATRVRIPEAIAYE
jgi:putative ABC transport system permease protein